MCDILICINTITNYHCPSVGTKWIVNSFALSPFIKCALGRVLTKWWAGIATDNGLGGQGIQPWCRRDFPHASKLTLQPGSLLYKGN
jgi:hypothetical protein